MRDEQLGQSGNEFTRSNDSDKPDAQDQSSPGHQDSCKPKLFHPRVFSPDLEEPAVEDDSPGSESRSEKEIRVRLGEIFPLLVDAIGSHRTWIDDFADDEIAIPIDLHDVLEAYRNFWSDAA